MHRVALWLLKNCLTELGSNTVPIHYQSDTTGPGQPRQEPRSPCPSMEVVSLPPGHRAHCVDKGAKEVSMKENHGVPFLPPPPSLVAWGKDSDFPKPLLSHL